MTRAIFRGAYNFIQKKKKVLEGERKKMQKNLK